MSEVRTGHDDRLVVLFSHHGVDTLTNARYGHRGPDGEPLLGAAEFLALLHRFGNVVLWLNGHTHINSIRAAALDPADPAARVLGGHHLRGGRLAVPDPGGRVHRRRRGTGHHLHDGGPRHAR